MTNINQVLKNNDPTAHAEVMAIRNACKKLNTYDLSNYILYTSCEPCPMCLSAIIWANIKNVYYGCTKEDAGNIGFRDDIIYQYLKGENEDLINLKQMDRDECIKAFEEYKNMTKNNDLFLAEYNVSAVLTPLFFAGIDFASTIPLLLDSSPPITAYSFLMSLCPFFSKSTAVQDKNALLTSICIIILLLLISIVTKIILY